MGNYPCFDTVKRRFRNKPYFKDNVQHSKLAIRKKCLFRGSQSALEKQIETVSQVRKKKGEVYNAYVKFNSIDNSNFSFRLKAFKHGQRYVVQELKGYNPLKDAPTQFYFFLDAYPTQTDVQNIQDNGLLPVVSLLTTV